MILKFYSPTCGPCKVLDKNLKESNVTYVNINIMDDGNIKELGNLNTEDVVRRFNIRAVPTLVKVNDNMEEVSRNVGLLTVDQIKEFVYGKND